MSTAFRKVWRDLWNNKGRTLLVVLSIAVGVLALGMTTASNSFLSQHMQTAQAESHPAHVRVTFAQPVSDDIVAAVAELPEVAEAEGYSSGIIRWKRTLTDEWREAQVSVIADYTAPIFYRLQLRAGAWPRADEIMVEAGQQRYFGVPAVGGSLFVKSWSDKPLSLTVSGAARDPLQLAPEFNPFNRASFYVSRDTAERIIGTRDFTEIRYSIPDYSPTNIQRAVNGVDDRLKRLGAQPVGAAFSLDIADPTGDRTQTVLNGLSLVLILMAVMSLGLSVTLVINTINAILTQQITQIGLMKTIGGETRQIATLYLAGVLVYGVLSLLVAVPLGAAGGYFMAAFWLQAMNIPPISFTLLPQVLLLQLAVGVLTPLLAALWPVAQGVRISVRQALAAYGVGTGRYGSGYLDRWMARITGLPRLLTLALRNTFRRAGRVALTEVTLVGAGTVFMLVVATSDSFDKTIDRVWASWGFDVLLVFDSFQRVPEMEAMIRAQPEVATAEMWTWVQAKVRRPDVAGAASEYDAELRGVPDSSQMFRPTLVLGRTLTPQDEHAVILNHKLATDLNIGLGDRVLVELSGGRETLWTVVGTASDIGVGGLQNSVFMRHSILNADLHQTGRATVAQITTREDTRAAQDRLKKLLQDYFEAQGIGVTLAIGQLENRELASALFGLISGLLQLMTVLMAMVGSIGLSGTLSINVMERRREIGVMRAVGASSGDITLIFAGEGLLLGLLSWALAVPLSMLGAQFFVQALGVAMNFPLAYRYAPLGVVLWLGIIVVLSLFASWLPARRATQISVRESLAYE